MTTQPSNVTLLLLFPLAYVLGMWIVSRLSGWASLARRYPAGTTPGPCKGRIHFGSLQLGIFGSYNHCIVWSVYESSLRLVPWFFLRMWHAPIDLPLEILSYRRRSRFWLIEGIDVVVPSGHRLWLPLLQARELRKASNGHFWPAMAQDENGPSLREAVTGTPRPLRTA